MSNQTLAIREDMSLSEVGNAFVKSGFFQDTRDLSQAIVKILAGREFGFGPFSSMTGVYIIQGRPYLAANLMAAAVKRSGRYDYRVREMAGKVPFIETGTAETIFNFIDVRRAPERRVRPGQRRQPGRMGQPEGRRRSSRSKHQAATWPGTSACACLRRRRTGRSFPTGKAPSCGSSGFLGSSCRSNRARASGGSTAALGPG